MCDRVEGREATYESTHESNVVDPPTMSDSSDGLKDGSYAAYFENVINAPTSGLYTSRISPNLVCRKMARNTH